MSYSRVEFHCLFHSLILLSVILLLPKPVPLSDREVISRLRNCLLALAAHKVLLYDTSVLYCYESSLSHPVRASCFSKQLFCLEAFGLSREYDTMCSVVCCVS